MAEVRISLSSGKTIIVEMSSGQSSALLADYEQFLLNNSQAVRVYSFDSPSYGNLILNFVAVQAIEG